MNVVNECKFCNVILFIKVSQLKRRRDKLIEMQIKIKQPPSEKVELLKLEDETKNCILLTFLNIPDSLSLFKIV